MPIGKKGWTLGADPEVFIATSSDKIIPVCGLFGGTKEKPIELDMSYWFGPGQQGFFYQEDNVALEFNIPPAKDYHSFTTYITITVTKLTQMVKEKGYKLHWQKSSHRFGKSELTHPAARLIGCSSDWCAYLGSSGKERKPFEISDLGTARHVGGHIHVGYDQTLCPPDIMATLMDAVVYYPVLSADKQTSRRPLYGLAGLYRPKEYGIEYRSMSNFWVNDSKILQSVARNASTLLNHLYNHQEDLLEVYGSLPYDDIRASIDEGECDKALLASIRLSFESIGMGLNVAKAA
jgi:hypothetical protein